MIKVELIAQPSIDATIGIAVVSALGPCWMDLIINFLAENRVLDNEKEANQTIEYVEWPLSIGCQQIASYTGDLLGGRISYVCTPEKVNGLLAELLDGVCNSHVRGRSLAHRAMTQGFWWLRM